VGNRQDAQPLACQRHANLAPRWRRQVAGGDIPSARL